ncbi:outer membrane protein assembly factor BamB family protein [Actinoplanes italicus]|uniref:Outer membrane protein assembly factor BamB n=1 Tax=Actinoplanes italicus TaxID=113567 RepID=A0A2T0KB42_9ACTN|nr:PQQ-binding-like beta-propeller repeat protein [Actinoplanes italicus]PRX20380.1 outer membrane protein assembly factor BamB [Actinoplanes italicus]
MSLSLILIATPAVASPAPLWDHPGYDAEDSHYNPSETVINAGSIRRLTEKWRAGLRTSDASCGGFSAPVLAGERIYVSDQLGISAYSTINGEILWRYDWDDPMDSETPRLAVTDGLLIVAGGDCNSQSDPDGKLLALDARTGLPRWRQRVDIPIYTVVVDKSTVVVSGGSPSDEDAVIAYRSRDGQLIWQKAKHRSSEVSADGTVLARATDGSDVTTGTSAAVDITTGRVRWTRKAVWTAQAAHPGSAVFYVTDKAGRLSAVQVGDGTPKWTVPGPASETIAVDRDRIYSVSGAGVEALKVQDGTRAWIVRRKAEAVQPILAGGLLYAGGPVLDVATGKVAGPALGGRVIVAGGRLHQVRDGVLSTLG